MYSSITSEALQTLSMGISKMMKECLFAYFSSGGAVTGRRKTVLRGCNLLLSAIQTEYETQTLMVDFAEGDVSLDLFGLYTTNGIWGMLEGKDFEALDMLFPIVGAVGD